MFIMFDLFLLYEILKVHNLSSFLKCDFIKVPFLYLGLTVGANMNLAKNWILVLDKISNKLSNWKAKNLSFAGRVTLCNAIIGSLPLYFMSLYRAPTNVIDAIEKLRRKFI